MRLPLSIEKKKIKTTIACLFTASVKKEKGASYFLSGLLQYYQYISLLSIWHVLFYLEFPSPLTKRPLFHRLIGHCIFFSVNCLLFYQVLFLPTWKRIFKRGTNINLLTVILLQISSPNVLFVFDWVYSFSSCRETKFCGATQRR